MAIYKSSSTYQLAVLVFIIFGCLEATYVSSFEYQVGGNNRWTVPPENETRMYNDWASKNRFTEGDTLRFRYKKDSVMEVIDTGYKHCNSTRPHFFSNNGNTVFNLNRSGSFYFISGASGHCDMGQKMIVRVIADEDSKSNGGGSISVVSVFAYGIVIAQFAFSFLF